MSFEPYYPPEFDPEWIKKIKFLRLGYLTAQGQSAYLDALQGIKQSASQLQASLADPSDQKRLKEVVDLADKLFYQSMRIISPIAGPMSGLGKNWDQESYQRLRRDWLKLQSQFNS